MLVRITQQHSSPSSSNLVSLSYDPIVSGSITECLYLVCPRQCRRRPIHVIDGLVIICTVSILLEILSNPMWDLTSSADRASWNIRRSYCFWLKQRRRKDHHCPDGNNAASTPSPNTYYPTTWSWLWYMGIIPNKAFYSPSPPKDIAGNSYITSFNFPRLAGSRRFFTEWNFPATLPQWR